MVISKYMCCVLRGWKIQSTFKEQVRFLWEFDPLSLKTVHVFIFSECKSWSWRLTTVWCRDFGKPTKSAYDRQRCTQTSVWHRKHIGIVQYNHAFDRTASIPGPIYSFWWNGVYPNCDRSHSFLLYIVINSAVCSVYFSKAQNNFLKADNFLASEYLVSVLIQLSI
jgi:hypothetical protein